MIYGCHFFQNIYILEVYIYSFFHWKCTSIFLYFIFDSVFNLKKIHLFTVYVLEDIAFGLILINF